MDQVFFYNGDDVDLNRDALEKEEKEEEKLFGEILRRQLEAGIAD